MDGERMLKFILVICCFINALYAKEGLAIDKRDQNILKVAMGLTVVADLLMIILGMNAYGILVFCLVQAVHNYRYTNVKRVQVQVVFGLIVFFAALFISGFDMLFSAGISYAIFVFYGLTGSFMAYKKFPYPNNVLIVLGMVLFAVCDIFVLLNGLPFEVFNQAPAYNIIQKGIWLCYLPSQVLLSSSARKIKTSEDYE